VQKQFNERSGGLLNRAQYPSDVIALAVLWRLRYKLSLRDLAEMFLIRGFVFSFKSTTSARRYCRGHDELRNPPRPIPHVPTRSCGLTMISPHAPNGNRTWHSGGRLIGLDSLTCDQCEGAKADKTYETAMEVAANGPVTTQALKHSTKSGQLHC
jgi:hypothetical protein